VASTQGCLMRKMDALFFCAEQEKKKNGEHYAKKLQHKKIGRQSIMKHFIQNLVRTHFACLSELCDHRSSRRNAFTHNVCT